MTLDIRAEVTCNLGRLISASLNDDYIQGVGLIKTSGSCELDGIYQPSPGDVVTFSYKKNGLTRYVPRKLRVLSSFADPFRGTTKVELGCKLTYLSDLQESIDWSKYDEYNDFEEDEEEIVTVPIYAQSIANTCCSKLGISPVPALTNKFSVEAFDFSSGYVNILSDLMVSENLCGYLDFDETLKIINLSAEGGTGPVLSKSNLLDISPIAFGQLPGDAVTVSYSSLRLKEDIEVAEPSPGDLDSTEYRERTLWERDKSESTGKVFIVTYTLDGTNPPVEVTRTYTGAFVSETTTTYRTINGSDVVASRFTEDTGPGISVTGSAATTYGQYYFTFNNANVVLSRTYEDNTYDYKGDLIKTVKRKYETSAGIVGASPIPWAIKLDGGGYGSINVSYSINDIPTEIIESTYKNSEYQSQETTRVYRRWAFTEWGQQAYSAACNPKYLKTTGRLLQLTLALLKCELVLDDVTQRNYAKGTSGRPPIERLTASANEPDYDDYNYSTDGSASLELALGSSTAERRIELSMPYAPHDTFLKNGLTIDGQQKYVSQRSDAPAKARAFGIAQNRLLLGNRSGMSIQSTPENIPFDPFSPIFIDAGGLTALYRTNGTAWTIDQSGIIVSTEALYWGVVGTSS